MEMIELELNHIRPANGNASTTATTAPSERTNASTVREGTLF